MYAQQPIFADVAQFFQWPVLNSGATPGVTIAAAAGTGFGYVTLLPQNYFVMTALRCQTNYDNAGGLYASADLGPIFAKPFIPNNFTCSFARGQNSTYSNQPFTQAEIASSGYRAGKQMPFPVVYGPRSNFAFTFTDSTGLFLQSGGQPVPLTIKMFMEGYNVPIDQWNTFLNYFPALANIFATPQ